MKYDNKTQQQLQAKTSQLAELAQISTREMYDELVEVLHFHEWRYYVQDDPILADQEYDALFDKLKQTEASHPSWIRLDSPTQRVGSDLSSDFQTVSHLSPMLSLPNSYNAEDLQDFDDSIKRRLLIEGAINYVVEPKFDGGTVVLVYDQDKLVRGATRGNGEAGDDITANVKTISSIPLQAAFSTFGLTRVEVRGEAIIRKDRFEQMNAERAKRGDVLFANPRNTATGGLRTKDPRETAARKIDAFVYQISVAEGPGADKIKTQTEALDILRKVGFKVPVNAFKACKNIEEVAAFCSSFEEKREDYPYEIDGMVVKVNALELQQRMGETSHHPRWAMAYKFKAKQATTILKQVVYQVGKVGTITPVAKVKPVALAGVTVSSISLHNEDFIQQKDLRIGDTVLIERAGDVIPYIVKSFPDLRDGSQVPMKFPERCPIPMSEDLGSVSRPGLIRDENEAAWRCPDCVCGAQDLQRMIFFVSKDAMNIDGMGKSIVEVFHKKGWLQTIADIYQLDFDQIKTLEGFGERSAEKLERAISTSKQNPIHRLLYSLGIHHLGRRASKIFAAEISNVFELSDWSEERMTGLKDIGPVLAKNVSEWFSQERNIELLRSLEASGVNISQTDEDRPKDFSGGPLAGKTILFTGTLKKMGRKEAQQIAESLGAKNISAVSKNLDILVAGEKAGSKLKKATALGTVQILSEDEFLALR